MNNKLPRDRILTRAVSLQSFGRSTSLSPQLQEVRTRDIYGFKVEPERAASYRAFYEKFLINSQLQTKKASALIDSGVLKNWSCTYARGKPAAEHQEYANVEALVRDGLPPTKRGEIWLQLTGVAAKVKLYQGVYESLLEPYEQAEQYEINSSPSTIQIEKDVPRTFPEYTYTPRGKLFQPALRRLLRAYAMRNPRLGYCQSMNFIAGGLLLFLDEPDAFWMLCFVVEEMLPDYFTLNIIGPQIDAEVLNEVVAEQLPELHEHFLASSVNTVLVSTQWFMCMFIRTLPYECAFRVWDALFFYGPQVLFEVGLAILKMHQPELLNMAETTDIASHLNVSLMDFFDCSRIWEIPITRIDPRRIASSRAVQKERVMRDMKMKEDILDLMDIVPNSKFSREDMEELYEQYASLNPKINDDNDVVETGLSKSVFQKVIMRMCQWQYEEYFMDRLFLYFDSNHSNHVDFKELILGLAVLIKGTNDEKLKMCFVLFDKNGDGYIDREELHTMLTALYTLCNNPSPPQTHRASQSGGAAQNSLRKSGGLFERSINPLSQSGGVVHSKRLSGGSPSPGTGSEPSTPVQSKRLAEGFSQSTFNLFAQLSLGGGAQSKKLSESVSQSSPNLVAQSNKLGDGMVAQSPDPATAKTPAPSEPESEKIAAPDYASEVAFFVDMLFKMADVTKDGLLSPDEFREAAMLQPLILKAFNLDHQQNYDVRISIGS